MARLAAEDLEAVRLRIEKAGLNRFTRSGFSGVTMREIAKDADVPLGSLYNYFADKETLFKKLLDQQLQAFLDQRNPFMAYLAETDFPHDLEAMAEAIAESVDHSRDYFKLMYVDVVEFEGRHIRLAFSNLEKKFKDALKGHFQKIGKLGPHEDLDASFAFVTIYLSLYQYFILTKLFGASNVFARGSDREVIKSLVKLFQNGLQAGKGN